MRLGFRVGFQHHGQQPPLLGDPASCIRVRVHIYLRLPVEAEGNIL